MSSFLHQTEAADLLFCSFLRRSGPGEVIRRRSAFHALLAGHLHLVPLT
jgi:hypothetical protein